MLTILLATATAALPPTKWFALVSVSTGECLDTSCYGSPSCSTIDLYACVQDGHNERFGYNETSKQITVGPGDVGSGPNRESMPGQCVEAVHGTPKAAAAASSVQAHCNDSNPFQQFTFHTITATTNSTAAVVIRSTAQGGDLCLTAGPSRPDTSVLLMPCAHPPGIVEPVID